MQASPIAAGQSGFECAEVFFHLHFITYAVTVLPQHIVKPDAGLGMFCQ